MNIIKKLCMILLAATMLIAGTACSGVEKQDAAETEKNAATPSAEPAEEPTEAPIEADFCESFTVSHTFSTHMVVQRGEYIRVWGWAPDTENGKKIAGDFAGVKAEALVENGEWTIIFKQKLDANPEGQSMRIYTDTQEEVFEDVLIGDVYIVTGQSNCAYQVSAYWQLETDDENHMSKEDVTKELPIRTCYNTQDTSYGNVEVRGSAEVGKDVKGKRIWKTASSSNVSSFSAIGYLFAYNYVKLTDGKIPVGLIEIDGNGRPLGSFLPNEVADEYGTDTYNKTLGYYKTTGVNAEWGRFLYNEYFAPYAKMAIAGMIWYQGESDLADNEANRYAEVWTAMVEYMRGTHNLINRDFPVYFIEFPPIYTQPSGYKGTNSWAYMDVGKIRGIMGSMVTKCGNVYQVQSGDLWTDRTFWNSLHPNCKGRQGRRLAKLVCALKGEAGVRLEEASGPIVSKVEFSKNGRKCTITFTNVGEGLKTSDGGDIIKGFLPLGSANTINLSGTVTAKIKSPDTVEITADSAMAGICYNSVTTYSFGNEITLMNSEGIPAGAFLYNR